MEKAKSKKAVRKPVNKTNKQTNKNNKKLKEKATNGKHETGQKQEK